MTWDNNFNFLRFLKKNKLSFILDQIDEIFEWDVKDDECLLRVRLSGTNQKGWLPIEVSFSFIVCKLEKMFRKSTSTSMSSG